MVYTFCTLFDKNYLYRGLALHESLQRHAGNFVLYILCLDSETLATLSALALPSVVLVPLHEVESEDVLRAKSNRSMVEYYWTLASVCTEYVARTSKDSESVAYIDSDIYFFSSPAPLYIEMGEDSVLIVKHNYPPRFQYLTGRSGIYNVGVVIFKRDAIGLNCLQDWRSQCIEWCYSRHEEGKFGDQMYLDSWVAQYKKVHVLQHLGGGVAPWNIGQYQISHTDNRVLIGPSQQLIFYHFHTLKILSHNQFVLHSSFYVVSSEAKRFIYGPYIQTLKQQIKKVQLVNPQFSFGLGEQYSSFEKWKGFLKRVAIHILFFYK